MATDIDAAIEAASIGWCVFPCGSDKRPLTAHGFKDASRDLEAVRAMWSAHPGAAVGIATGASDLVVIDVDVKNGAPGMDKWAELSEDLGRAADETTQVRTPSGGLHVYYRANGARVTSTVGKLAPGIDTRADGGYVIGAGSPGYAYVPDHGPDRLRKLPALLAERLSSTEPASNTAAETPPDVIPQGQRDATLTSLAGTMRRRGMSADAIFAALKVTNEKRCQPPLAEREVEKIAASVARYEPQEQAADSTPETPLLRRLADVEPRAVEWLWPRRIPFGMPSVLFGPTGLGKSHVWMDLVARVSIGAFWTDGGEAPIANCVVLSAEDDPETVIVPRLTFSGADLSKVFVFPSVAIFDPEKGRRAFSFREDAARLEAAIRSVSAQLAVVDPITAYLRGVDSHRTTEVREVLAIVDDIARRTGAAILCIGHPNKNDGTNTSAIHRLSGSAAFGDAARSVMALVSDPDDEERRLLLPVKMSIAAKPQGLGFRITAASPDTCESAVVWDRDPVTVDADEAFGSSRADSPAIDRAKDFLLGQLADGEWQPAKTLIDAAAARGISDSTLKRARDKLGVKWRKEGFSGGFVWRIARGSR
jgi:hypothetical protein